MPRRDESAQNGTGQEIAVTLKPILGIRPGIYLTALYGVGALLVVFLLLLLPGLANRGTFVEFDVQPGRASVIVDGTFAGTTPGPIFLKQGRRHVEIRKAFYQSATMEMDIGGRVFATLLFPPRIQTVAVLSVSDPKGLIEYAFNDFADNPFIPQIVRDTALLLRALQKDQEYIETKSLMYDFIFNCMYYVNPLLSSSIGNTSAEEQLALLIDSAAIVESGGAFLAPSSITGMVQKIVQLNDDYPNISALLLLSLSQKKAGTLSNMPWITGHFSKYRDALSRYYDVDSIAEFQRNQSSPVLSIDGIPFRSIPKGILVMGKDDDLQELGKSIDLLLPHPVAVRSFYLSENEVTNSQYQAFVQAMPPWRPSNRGNLVKNGLVTNEYLSGWTNDRYPEGKADLPVACVSYAAAEAFCEWFSAKARLTISGSSARLPSEAEWEWAARGGLRGMPYPLGEKPGNAVFFSEGIRGPQKAGASDRNGYGLRDMMGNVWEWCVDSFGSADYLITGLDPDRNAELKLRHPVSTDKVVRGGAWNSQKESIRVYTRGSQRREWCTPYLGFRIAVSAP